MLSTETKLDSMDGKFIISPAYALPTFELIQILKIPIALNC